MYKLLIDKKIVFTGTNTQCYNKKLDIERKNNKTVNFDVIYKGAK